MHSPIHCAIPPSDEDKLLWFHTSDYMLLAFRVVKGKPGVPYLLKSFRVGPSLGRNSKLTPGFPEQAVAPLWNLSYPSQGPLPATQATAGLNFLFLDRMSLAASQAQTVPYAKRRVHCSGKDDLLTAESPLPRTVPGKQQDPK